MIMVDIIATDSENKPWALVKSIQRGDLVRVDGGFECMEADAERDVRMYDGDLYIVCNHGMHFLAGQHEEEVLFKNLRVACEPYYIGIYKI
jgi:hypothetical protein